MLPAAVLGGDVMADETKGSLVTEITEAYCQIYGGIADQNQSRHGSRGDETGAAPRPDPHDVLALAVWCVLEGRKDASDGSPSQPPPIFTVR